jgi:hypothetical protein
MSTRKYRVNGQRSLCCYWVEEMDASGVWVDVKPLNAYGTRVEAWRRARRLARSKRRGGEFVGVVEF